MKSKIAKRTLRVILKDEVKARSHADDGGDRKMPCRCSYDYIIW